MPEAIKKPTFVNLDQKNAPMLNDILDIANRYASGLQHVHERKDKWIKKHDELKEHLTAVAVNLNAGTAYKQGFFVDSLHAFYEDMNGTCSEMRSLVFRSGDMPMQVVFSNEKGDKKEFTEHGFQVTFTPMVTGEIIVLLLPHYSELNKTPPSVTSLAIFNDPLALTMDETDKLIARGMEMAYFTSFTGIAEQQAEDELPSGPPKIPHHNTIGFKRYETTEKNK